MKKITKLFLIVMTIMLSSTVIFAQNYAISAEESAFIQKQEFKLQIEHGSTVVVPPSREVLAVGDDCTTPIVVTAGAIPYIYTDLGQYTCGRGNNYSNTDLGGYDGGEDIIYELVLSELTSVKIDMNPNGTTWTGIGLFDACPDVGTSIGINTGSSGTVVKSITATLAAGSYYIMVDTWPSPTCIPSFDLTITTSDPPPPPDPVTAFPFSEDFESGTFPSTMVPITNTQSNLTVVANAANSSNFGAMFEGGPDSWGATPTDVTAAFAYTFHVAKLEMVVTPDGSAGDLLLEFDLTQRYSYNTNYEWFRVLVNGVPVSDTLGNMYYQAGTDISDPWQHLVYNLSAYQNLSSFNITIENSAKYRYQYYKDGDLAYVDNVELFYYYTAPVPITNWALYIGIILIAGFIVIRFKKSKLA